MNNKYELILIGGGISACTFASDIIKNGFKGKIAIIENGRGLGGRTSTRISKLQNESVVDHGSPNFNITNFSRDSLLDEFISKLLFKNLIKKDDSFILKIDKNLKSISKHNSEFYKGNIFKSNGYMSDLSRGILNLNNINDQIDFYFNKTITDFYFKKGEWLLSTKNNEKFRCNFLVSSSNLIAHPRSIKILKLNQVPLRTAIPTYENQVIDEIISLLEYQKYLKRINLLLFSQDKNILNEDYLNKNIHILFTSKAEEEFGFERIILQKQMKKFHNIVFHTKESKLFQELILNNDPKEYLNYSLNFLQEILKVNHLSNDFINIKDFSLMFWRGSQPIHQAIPNRLQICKEYNIAFCGDWFDFEGFGRVEGAIISALKLSNKLNSLIY